MYKCRHQGQDSAVDLKWQQILEKLPLQKKFIERKRLLSTCTISVNTIACFVS